MKIILLRFLLVLALFSFSPLVLFSSDGESTANFLKLGVGARAVAMGESFVAVADDVSAVYWNPAGLPQLGNHEIMLMHHKMAEGINQEFLAYNFPYNENHAFGFGLNYVHYGNIQEMDGSGNPVGNQTVSSDLAFSASVGRKTKWGNGGLTGKYVQKNLAGITARTFCADLGILASLSQWIPGFTAGAVLQNLGFGMKFDSQKSSLPRLLNFGAAYSGDLFENDLIISAQSSLFSDGKNDFLSGLEYKIYDMFSVRFGYKTFVDIDQGFRCGGGFNTKNFSLDYAFIPFGAFGSVHMMNFSVRFGKQYRLQTIQSKIDKNMTKARIFYGKGDLVNANKQLQNILYLDPSYPAALELKDKISGEFHLMDEERRRKNIELNLKNAVKHYYAEDYESARDEFESVLVLEPSNNYAVKYLKKIDDYFTQIRRKNAQSLMKEGQELMDRGEFIDAIAKYQTALGLMPDDQVMKDKIVEVQGKIDAARAKAASAAEARQISDLLARAKYQYELRNDRETLSLLEELFKLSSDHPDGRTLAKKARERIADDLYYQGNVFLDSWDMDHALAKYKEAASYGDARAESAAGKLEVKITARNVRKSYESYTAGIRAMGAEDYETAFQNLQNAVKFDASNESAAQAFDRVKKRLGR